MSYGINTQKKENTHNSANSFGQVLMHNIKRGLQRAGAVYNRRDNTLHIQLRWDSPRTHSVLAAQDNPTTVQLHPTGATCELLKARSHW